MPRRRAESVHHSAAGETDLPWSPSGGNARPLRATYKHSGHKKMWRNSPARKKLPLSTCANVERQLPSILFTEAGEHPEQDDAGPGNRDHDISCLAIQSLGPCLKLVTTHYRQLRRVQPYRDFLLAISRTCGAPWRAARPNGGGSIFDCSVTGGSSPSPSVQALIIGRAPAKRFSNRRLNSLFQTPPCRAWSVAGRKYRFLRPCVKQVAATLYKKRN